MLSRLQIYENGNLSYSCGRWKSKVFEHDDVKVRVQCTRPQISINMAVINGMLVPLLFGPVSRFFFVFCFFLTLVQLQVAYIKLQGDYARRNFVFVSNFQQQLYFITRPHKRVRLFFFLSLYLSFGKVFALKRPKLQ